MGRHLFYAVPMNDIEADIAAHHWTAALVSTLILIAGLTSQGKIQPFLARFTAWQKTITLLIIVQLSVGAASYASGVSLGVAAVRAAPPLFIALLTHYLGVPKDIPATAQKTADVAAEKADSVVTPKLPPPLPPGATSCLALLALTISLSCSGAQRATEKDVITKGLSFNQKVCIVEKVLLGTTDPELVMVQCDLVPALLTEVVELIGITKQGKSQATLAQSKAAAEKTK